jgi:hypothetical protein
MNCRYCKIELRAFADIRREGDAVACVDVDACNARVREAERQRREGLYPKRQGMSDAIYGG